MTITANPPVNIECRAWVVGLGSPHGDDRIGWEVVNRLWAPLPANVRADVATDPMQLADVPVGCGLLLVIDASRGTGPVGSVNRFVWPDPRLSDVGGISTHGVGLPTALELLAALGRLPNRVVVLTAEGIANDPGSGLTPEVEAAIPELIEQVLSELATE
ncbi:MAG: hydrogenase maturation protease [Gemmataceae bacterium]